MGIALIPKVFPPIIFGGGPKSCGLSNFLKAWLAGKEESHTMCPYVKLAEGVTLCYMWHIKILNFTKAVLKRNTQFFQKPVLYSWSHRVVLGIMFSVCCVSGILILAVVLD